MKQQIKLADLSPRTVQLESNAPHTNEGLTAERVSVETHRRDVDIAGRHLGINLLEADINEGDRRIDSMDAGSSDASRGDAISLGDGVAIEQVDDLVTITFPTGVRERYHEDDPTLDQIKHEYEEAKAGIYFSELPEPFEEDWDEAFEEERNKYYDLCATEEYREYCRTHPLPKRERKYIVDTIIPAHQCHVICGESGAQKTSILLTLLRR